jgi:hypothetical protein
MDFTQTPKNSVRYFDLYPDRKALESLAKLRSIGLYGNTLTGNAEGVVLNWARASRGLLEMNYGFFEKIAEKEGYIPIDLKKVFLVRPDPEEENRGHLRLGLSGITKFYFEMIPVTEYALEGTKSQRINPDYLKSSEQVIISALQSRLPLEIDRVKRLGLIKE